MKIETTLNLGAEIWRMVNNRPEKLIVRKVTVVVWETKIEVHYSLFLGDRWEGEINDGAELYFTKQELLNSL